MQNRWESFKSRFVVPEEEEYGIRFWVEWVLLIAFCLAMGVLAIRFHTLWPFIPAAAAFVLFGIRHPWGNEMPG